MNREKSNELAIIKACKQGKRTGQRSLYELYYSYGMSVSLRYASNLEEAQEVLNDGFFKVFKKIHQYNSSYAFKPWFRRILINAAIDYHRKYEKLKQPIELHSISMNQTHNVALDNLGYEEVIKLVQQLSPVYRMVFNLAVVEGYKHHEIATELGISIGASKSNLAKARKKLQVMVDKLHGRRAS